MENNYIEFNEIDYIIPAETYSVAYSYLSKQGFPFTKDFLLRVLHISSLSKYELASFFGFNPRELDVALEEPINKNEVCYLDDGRLSLTSLSKGYFSSLDDKPMVEKPQSRSSTISFELLGFNKVGKQHGGWYTGLRLAPDNEIKSASEQHAKSMFSKHFHRLVESGDLGKIRTEGKSIPSLYSIDKVTREKSVAHRIKRTFEINFDNKVKPFYVNKSYENDEAISQAIVQDTDNLRLGDNLKSIQQAWDAFKDMSVERFVKCGEIDFRSMILEMADNSESKPYELLIGSLYSSQPWKKLEEHLKRLKPSKQQGALKKLKWIGANTRYWGMSESFTKTKDSLLSHQKKKDGICFDLMLYLPCEEGPKAKEKGSKSWKHKLGKLPPSTGVVNGLFDGNVEVMILDNEFAAVCYHLLIPDLSPVHIPLGFFTTDKELVQHVSSVVNNFLEGATAYDKPNLLGLIN